MADDHDDEYGTAGLMDDPEGYYPPTPPPTQTVFTMKSGHSLTLNLVGSSPTEAHHLWNGAKIISDYFEASPRRVKDKTVLELGAASGLPSLVAGLLGAKKVVMSDYPDVEIVQNMQKNIDLCDEGAPADLRGRIGGGAVDAAGFVWGADVRPILARLPPAHDRFDVLILADLLFRHSEHGALVKTISEAMAEEGVAFVFFTSYRPWMREKDMKFFDVAREAGLLVEKVEEVRLEKPMFEGDPGDLEVQKTANRYTFKNNDYDGEGLREKLDRDGFVKIRASLRSAYIIRLQAITEAVEQRARQGQWPHVRTIGKQFPPWDPADAVDRGVWGVQHLLKPTCPFSEEYADLYFSEGLLRHARALMSCTDDDLVMELFNMLIRPERDFELRWHRDDIPPEATAEEELERLNQPSWHVQYNLSLYHDTSLIVVPGSHKRARTAVERAAGPYDELPDQVRVQMDVGDIVFYNNNILHRGAYDSTKERTTLHGSVGHVNGSKHRARNVLQHGVGDWGMRDRLIKLGSESGDVGYSLHG
ncbi:hypothetical protein NLU13_9837 [Sarocladium strictum]|uniref:Protein N-terminal and lysine N-methyltransferase EFM7 n=1 Tax=Sarocladium strictum TaxID=5046 RepID=A0AA39L372_SARSR|nr:hypothetical protein NLU13_9837 [Sarocladium strictum]